VGKVEGMTITTADMDPRVLKIIKELMAWQNTEFDLEGHPVRRFEFLVESPPTCPDTVLDDALHGLRDMQEWAKKGHLLEAKRDLDDLERECRVDDDS
jgi:hypothetical protein